MGTNPSLDLRNPLQEGIHLRRIGFAEPGVVAFVGVKCRGFNLLFKLVGVQFELCLKRIGKIIELRGISVADRERPAVLRGNAEPDDKFDGLARLGIRHGGNIECLRRSGADG